MNPDTVVHQHMSMQRCCALLNLYRDTCVCMCARLFLGGVEKCVTEVAIRRVSPLPMSPPGCSGSWIQHAGFGDGCDQVLVLSVPPAPPTDFRLTAACYHSAILLVPETKTEGMRSHTIRNNINSVKINSFPLYIPCNVRDYALQGWCHKVLIVRV